MSLERNNDLQIFVSIVQNDFEPESIQIDDDNSVRIKYLDEEFFVRFDENVFTLYVNDIKKYWTTSAEEMSFFILAYKDPYLHFKRRRFHNLKNELLNQCQDYNECLDVEDTIVLSDDSVTFSCGNNSHKVILEDKTFVLFINDEEKKKVDSYEELIEYILKGNIDTSWQKPLDFKQVKEQLSKLGEDYAFYIKQVQDKIFDDDNIFRMNLLQIEEEAFQIVLKVALQNGNPEWFRNENLKDMMLNPSYHTKSIDTMIMEFINADDEMLNEHYPLVTMLILFAMSFYKHKVSREMITTHRYINLPGVIALVGLLDNR